MAFTPLNTEKHKNLKISNKLGLERIAKQHILPANARDFAQLATSFPIFFIKEQEQFRPVIMLGFEAGENLYYRDEKLDSLHIPHSVSVYPFGLGLDAEKENTLTICIDTDSDYVGEDKDHALFNEDGSETDMLKSMHESLGRLYDNEVMTEKFSKELNEKELIQEFEINLSNADDSKKRLVGLYSINETKLRELSDEDVLDYHKRGLYIPLHAMMVSMTQVHRLVQFRNTHTDNKIKGIQIRPRVGE
jgi:hypothetical protein